ncbi:hypothetical protein BVG16_07630 [Paenibacillus selenitireducens]|uniref:Uncharacterized protein n=1 Tax=Paenibacillus selenitireducens TaxID=1324314 RepID=A0A1T2XL85_9BACL|nr:hypothetical protein [Paenibacillus selenitireducens]OPA80582.1 hypothetical protein BVG16_07630 [Paenibacillus selenitireducens]
MKRVKAMLTKQGILYQNSMYSCRQAFSGQWFAIVDHVGELEIDIFYDSNNPNGIYLDSGYGCICCNKLLPNRIDEVYEMEYYNRLQEILILRKNEK